MSNQQSPGFYTPMDIAPGEYIDQRRPMGDEVYLPIQGYEGLYEVSNLGNVRSLPGGRRQGIVLSLAKMSSEQNTYRAVSLSKGNIRKSYSVHRLVAQAFLPNIEEKRTVNHKDGIKSNNCVDNLEWATYQENIRHAIDVLGVEPNNKGKKFISSYCPNGHEFTEENSYYHDIGGRMCRTCHNNRERDRKRKVAASKRELQSQLDKLKEEK